MGRNDSKVCLTMKKIENAAEYQGQVAPADADFPFGSFKDDPTPGLGTPFVALTENEWQAYLQKALGLADITPNGLADTVGSSQIYSALQNSLMSPWDAEVRYTAGALAKGSDGEAYRTTAATKGLDPVADSTGVWLPVNLPDSDIRKHGAVSGSICNAAIASAIAATGRATLSGTTFAVVLSAPVEVPEKAVVDLNNNNIAHDGGYTPNATKTSFFHTGDSGRVLNVRFDDIPAGDKLIGYSPGVTGCLEAGCATGRGTNALIRFEGTENANVSDTLAALAATKLRETPIVKVLSSRVEIPASSGLTFKRTRHLPSECRIKNIKVTDENGSPNFSFSLAMRAGASFVYPFQRAVAASDINTPVDIDWFYDSFDDILSFEIDNQKASATVFNIEIQYLDGVMGRDDNAWAYQSILDFNRPHDYGAANILAAKRGVEYRSTPVGEPLDVRAAITTRSTFDNYGYPETTIPTPSGSQDLTESSELKFYFNFSAGMAMSTGATHVRFRLYQQTRQVKCTCINGFLSQKPDWATGAGHLATSFQPDIEIDLSGATRDTPQEVLIPLDAKAMQNAVIEAEGQDLHYFYLTFFQNLPGHVPIEWGDVWEWECDFIRM